MSRTKWQFGSTRIIKNACLSRTPIFTWAEPKLLHQTNYKSGLVGQWFSRQSQNGAIWAEITFGSAHVKIGVWPKVGLQAFCTPGQACRTPQPLQIKSAEFNWVKHGTSHEPNQLNWVRLMWSTAFDSGLRLVYISSRFLQALSLNSFFKMSRNCWCALKCSVHCMKCTWTRFFILKIY